MRTVYTVGQANSEAEFRSIQEAIDQAVADGHDNSDPATIRVDTGIYVEDVALAAGVNVEGMPEAQLQGTVTVDLVDQGSLETTVVFWRQVTIAPQGPGAPGILFTGTTAQQGRFIECLIQTADGDGLVSDNTGSDGGNPSQVALVQCNLGVSGAGNVGIRHSSGFVFGALGQVELDDNSELALLLTGGFVFLSLVSIRGRINVSGPSVFVSRRLDLEALGGAALLVDAPGTALLEGGTMISSDTSPSIDGDGTLARDLISYNSTGTGVSATLTDIIRPVDQSTNITYTPAAPGDWVGAPPTEVATAMDRMASLLVTLNGGAIP